MPRYTIPSDVSKVDRNESTRLDQIPEQGYSGENSSTQPTGSGFENLIRMKFFLTIFIFFFACDEKKEEEVCFREVFKSEYEANQFDKCPSLEEVTAEWVGKGATGYGYIYEFKSGPVRWQYENVVACCYAAITSKD